MAQRKAYFAHALGQLGVPVIWALRTLTISVASVRLSLPSSEIFDFSISKSTLRDRIHYCAIKYFGMTCCNDRRLKIFEGLSFNVLS